MIQLQMSSVKFFDKMSHEGPGPTDGGFSVKVYKFFERVSVETCFNKGDPVTSFSGNEIIPM